MPKTKTFKKLEDLPDALKQKIAEIQPEVASLSDSNIRKRYEIGKILHEIVLDASGKYGASPLKRMQQVMPLSKDSLRPMLELAKHYDDDDVDKLISLRHPETDEHLNFTHVVALTRVKDKVKAMKLAEQAATSGWTSKELNREVIRLQGGPKSRGGRKQGKADTFPNAVADVTAKLTSIENAIDQVWTAPGGLADLYETLAAAPGWRPDQSLEDSMKQVSDKLVATNFKLTGLLQLVDGLKHRVEAARKIKSAA